MSETTFIYALIDPRDYRIRYIGKSDEPQLRVMQHMQEQRRWPFSNPHFGRWLRELGLEELKPLSLIIETVDKLKWKKSERHWISTLRSAGFNILNWHMGGTGGDTRSGRKHSERTKKLMSEVAFKNRKNRAKAGRAREDRKPWTLGLTKETDPRIAALGRKISASARKRPRDKMGRFLPS